jgi:hypothetical protein
VTGRPGRAWRAIRELLAVQVELHDRMALRDRPWEEEFLHWAADGRVLHGTVPPPAGRRRGTTRSGWCPGPAGAEVRQTQSPA